MCCCPRCGARVASHVYVANMRITVQPTLPGTHPRFSRVRDAWQQQLDHPAAATPPADWATTTLRRIADAAIAAGYSPHDLQADRYAGSAFQQLADTRGWSAATCCKYLKAGWAYGLAWPRLPTPEPLPGPRSLPELYLLDDTSPPTVIRAAVWCRLTAVWPASLADWAALPTTAITIEGDDTYLDPAAIDPAATPRRIVGAGTVTRRWLTQRQQLPGPSWLCTLRAGPGSRPGAPLAVRSLEAAFTAHTRRAATLAAELAQRPHDPDPSRASRRATYRHLTYDTYRRLLLAAGAQPARPNSRGSVRARR